MSNCYDDGYMVSNNNIYCVSSEPATFRVKAMSIQGVRYFVSLSNTQSVYRNTERLKKKISLKLIHAFILLQLTVVDMFILTKQIEKKIKIP